MSLIILALNTSCEVRTEYDILRKENYQTRKTKYKNVSNVKYKTRSYFFCK